MKKGFALTLMTVAIALIQVSTSHATAPVIADPGDVIIGDLEHGATPATGTNIFVYPDAIDADAIVSDDTATDAQIKWSFLVTPTGRIKINGVSGVASSLAGLDADDPTSPRASSRIDLNDTDPGDPVSGKDANPRTFTFRNATLTPNNATQYLGPAGFITSQTATVTLFASDCSTFSARAITVFTAQRTSDAISGGGPQLLFSQDFAASTAGWIGGAVGGFGGTVSNGASGLCMTVPAAGNNFVLWLSPEGYVELVANTVYRVRTQVSMSAPSNPAAGTIPLWFFVFDNFNTGGNGNNYGGFDWVLDVDGGAEGVGRANGRTTYDFWYTPNAVNTAQWNSGAFTVAADAINDTRLTFEIIDANAALLTNLDAGTICVKSIEVSSVLRDNLTGSTVYNPPINTATHFAGANNDFGAGSTASINNGTASASITLATTVDARRTVGPFNSTLANLNLQLYPVVWEGNTLYRVKTRVRAAAAETDPVDAMFVVADVTNNELGMQSFTTRSGGSAMVFSASPKLTAATYEGYFFGQNATSSATPDANRLRGMMFPLNGASLFGSGTGSNGIVVESLEVEKLTGGVN